MIFLTPALSMHLLRVAFALAIPRVDYLLTFIKVAAPLTTKFSVYAVLALSQTTFALCSFTEA